MNKKPQTEKELWDYITEKEKKVKQKPIIIDDPSEDDPEDDWFGVPHDPDYEAMIQADLNRD